MRRYLRNLWLALRGRPAPITTGLLPFAFGSRTLPGLSKIAEEAGEVVQIVGKLMMTGGNARYWEEINLDLKLEEELADLQAAINFFLGHNADRIDVRRYYDRSSEKMKKFIEWHAEQSR